MTQPTDDFESRKQLLVARSTLGRLKLQHDAARLRESLTFGNVGAAVVKSPVVRSAAFLLAVEIAGSGRIARLLSFAGQALSVARMAGVALAWLKAPSHPAGPPAP
ncbi:MAG: hypothetical protein IPL06_08785 [Betaproteobacteria bacterium]|nr:hypothetical protein [Betaproteobacteria bacterium]